jgi:hypothetical protein
MPSSNSAEEIATLVDQMIGSMRPPECDLAMFASGAEKMFATFPIEACRVVADPARGYPSTERFAPTLAGLRIALEEAARPAMWKLEREARERKHAEEWAQEQAAMSSGPRPTYEEIQHQFAELGLVIGPRRGRRTFDVAAEAERVRQQYGISKSAWDAVPRARPE